MVHALAAAMENTAAASACGVLRERESRPRPSEGIHEELGEQP